MKCPWCGAKMGKESLLGKLGKVLYYRCRYCGGQSSKRVKK